MASGEFRLVNGKKKRMRAVENNGMASGENSKKRKRKRKRSILIPDDLLLEIMLRLPDSRSVLRCAAVCKQWHSLIHSPQFSFRRRFMTEERKPSTFSILFKFSRFQTEPFYHLTPTWSSPSSVPKPYDLSFMPNSDFLITKASSADLLLLSETRRRYYICNFLTKYWFSLPTIPYYRRLDHPLVRIQSSGSALVLDPNDTHEPRLGRYRVVLVRMAWFVGNLYHCTANVFVSETGLWTRSHLTAPFPCPRHTASIDTSLDLLTAANGSVYWLDGLYDDFKVMASLDPFAMELRLVPLPARNFNGTRLLPFKERVRCGVVRGRVRVSRTIEANGRFYPRLRVWELDSRDNTWELVHNVRVETKDKAAVFFVLGFDPNDGDAVFVVRDGEVFRYEIGRDEYVLVCKFPCGGVSLESVKRRVGRYLKVVTLVHPIWPTKLPNGRRCKRRIRRRIRRRPTKLENAILSICNKRRRIGTV